MVKDRPERDTAAIDSGLSPTLVATPGDVAATDPASHQTLDSGDLLTNLAGQRLLQASTRDGSPMPTDLYLRSGFFATAHLDRWELGQLRLMRASPNSPAEDRQLQEGMRGVPEQ